MARVPALQLIDYVWLAWILSWIIAAFWQDRAVRRPATSSEILYRVVSTVGWCLMFGIGARLFGGDRQLWQLPPMANALLVVVAVSGVAFTWWARIHIGRLWSSSVTRKADHHVVDSGPYALVRHPIYSGVCLSAIATASVRGTFQGWLGACVVILGFYIKARLEERFLREELGPAYDEYARRVAMLVPFARQAR